LRYFLLLLLLAAPAYAQDVFVLSCPADWGASSNCGGCSRLIWTKPDANDKVKTDANQYWTRLGTLAASAKVDIATGKTEGATATCAAVTGTSTAGVLLGSTPPPPPPPPVVTGDATITWTAATQCADGTAIANCGITSYRIEYGTSDFASRVTVAGSVRTYTFVGLPAVQHRVRLVALAGTAESAPTNSVTFTPSAAPPPPPPVDCAVSTWSDWIPAEWSACANAQQSRTETRTRTITTPAANGGAACPSLTETRTVRQACVVALTYTCEFGEKSFTCTR
jgi:hypothetical protein